MSRSGRWVAAGLLAAVLPLAACSGDYESTSGGSGAASSDVDAGGDASLRESADRDAQVQRPRASVRTTAVVKKGQVILSSKDPAGVLDDIEDLVAAYGGTIDKAETSNDDEGRVERSSVVLRVPVDAFDAATKALEKLGTLEFSQSSEKDVTTQVIDVDERVETLQNSLDNLQQFQQRATNVRDLLRYEDEITARTAELQSLKQQRSYLADQTSMSTISVELTRPEKVVREEGPLEDAGFLTGLRSGWDGLVGFGIVVLTLFGLVLPFLVAGVLVGVPVWLAARELLRRRRTAAPEPAASETA